MQQRVVLWILETFWTSPSLGIEAIASLIPIHLHLKKLSGRLQLRTQLLPTNYIIKSMLESRHSTTNNNYCLLLKRLTPKQQLNIKGPIVDANNRLNRIFNSFNSFSCKFSLGNKLINIFPSHFSFYLSDRKNVESKKAHIHKLNELILQALVDSRMAVVVSDISIKNQVAMSIAHIYVHDNPVIKTLHHTVNVTSTEAKLFVIKCGLNQTIQLNNIKCIVIITDSIHMAKRIFDSFIYPCQVQILSISKELREFFKRDRHNSIEFWKCPSQDK